MITVDREGEDDCLGSLGIDEHPATEGHLEGIPQAVQVSEVDDTGEALEQLHLRAEQSDLVCGQLADV